MSNGVIAACDGACLNNPGPAGWGWVIADSQERVVRWACGPLGDATNNIAELVALKELLSELDPGTELEVRMDSRYAMDAVTKWLPKWKANGWQTASKKPVANRDIIVAIDALLARRTVKFVHVPAHQVDGDVLNALADRAASAAATSQRPASGTSADGIPEAADEIPSRRRTASRKTPASAGIAAKFPGVCRCGMKYRPGDKIIKGDDGKWGHPECAAT